ncbi:hypothetical protein Psed_6861 (plasmid) [Pseudonocardia dioxanivorans CB1190]|uniref:Uncharacterized protein n=1 Tax=Pseudonocardia dioxanivorans (strain ATCC 55486 / DSM 44775 / JCM 13855 / CB1190) TaxID=675635 RepID=F2L6N8_PSEUX|nr:hypothetical protein [Pseudonocardia dioxanivorans]AEA28932.1 hypothetical protein Psed_6861 [Pseudonocardia dioxanivorans CB1190]GJF02878.1 hypothetical protein PSD17_18400 [Pseudonocardia sp. D17]
MPVEISARYFDPNDPDDELARRFAAGQPAAAGDLEAELPWVEPDYASIPSDADLPWDADERDLVWPGPAMIMPAGLLPDGRPYSRDERDNASRICGEVVTSGVEADAVVRAYDRQQKALRDRAGLPWAVRGANGLEDLPETLQAIAQLHREERVRRRQAHRSRWAR